MSVYGAGAWMPAPILLRRTVSKVTSRSRVRSSQWSRTAVARPKTKSTSPSTEQWPKYCRAKTDRLAESAQEGAAGQGHGGSPW
ncbi:hypothetical protein A6A07_01335 [Streptomyces sp. CB03911]|nr:hypothetical protein A6A07_01335 [Streptomyces sp. CB03911]